MQLDRNGYYDLPPGKIASLVTYLEMTEPPAPRALPDGPGLALRRVERPKLDWYRDLFRRIGTDWLWFGRLVMPDAEVEAIIRHPEVEVYALTRNGSDAGLLELDRREPPDIELAYFGVTPELTGQGAGRWLMHQAMTLAWRHRPAPLLGPHLHPRPPGRSGVLPPLRLSRLPPCRRGRRRPAPDRPRPARVRELAAADRG